MHGTLYRSIGLKYQVVSWKTENVGGGTTPYNFV